MKPTTHTLILVVLALLVGPLGLRGDQASLRGGDPLRLTMGEAPEAWNQQDPADSLYRSAREAMNRGDYERAAALFHTVWNAHPRSTYAPDAPYWEAFSRYRLGETAELETALRLLALQSDRYEKATTRQNGDAASLATRVRGLLARRGNADAAEIIVASANEVAGTAVGVSAEAAVRVEERAREIAVQQQAISRQSARTTEQAVTVTRVAGGSASERDIPEHCRERVESQLAALSALVHMNAERGLPVLRRVMERRDECAALVRRRAIFMIADKRSPKTVDMLLAAARTDPDLEVRRQAVFWLSEVDDPRAVDALEGFLDESDDEKIRERAIFALSQHSSPRAKQILRRLAGDDAISAELRSKAIFWLGSEGTREDVEFLKGMFGRVGDRKLNERILFAVGQSGHRDDAAWLLTVASNERVDTKLRGTAIFWAAETGASVADLASLYGRLQDRKLKERVIFGLSESPHPQAIDRLIQIARTEKDAELRKKAIFWLGNSNDERAASFLMEVLTGSGGGR